MTPAGWAFMLISTSLVTSLVIFCFYKVLTAPHLREPRECAIDDERRTGRP